MFKAAVTKSSGVKPAEQSILFTTVCTDIRQKISRNSPRRDATLCFGCCRRTAQMTRGKSMQDTGAWLSLGWVRLSRRDTTTATTWKSGGINKLSSSDRRVLPAHWVGEAVAKLESDRPCHRRLNEKTALAMTAETVSTITSLTLKT